MSFFSFKKPQVVITLQEQGSRLADDVRTVARQASAHLKSLAELLRLELEEYFAQQMRRMAFFAVACVMLLVAYLCLCACACVLLAQWLESWVWATGIVFLFNFMVGLIALLRGRSCKPGPFAAATREELKNDVKCLKILLSDESKNS